LVKTGWLETLRYTSADSLCRWC